MAEEAARLTSPRISIIVPNHNGASETVGEKHAYCIMAHHEPDILRLLIGLLDDVCNDLFVHIDAKADFSQFETIATRKSKLIFTKRMAVCWGDISQVKLELLLFETALKQGDYAYIHLLSGADLPLKSQSYIRNFFQSVVNGANVIGIDSDDFNRNTLAKRTSYYYVFTNMYRCENRLVRKLISFIRRGGYLCKSF